MESSEKKPHPPLLVWAGAAVAVVLLVGVPLFLLRGGDEPSEPATTIAAPETTTTTHEPTTSSPGETTTTAPMGRYSETLVVYLFSDRLETAIGDPALVSVEVTETYDTSQNAADLLAEAVILLSDEAILAEGYSTSIPEGVRDGGVSVGIDGGVATIGFNSAFESGGGSMAMFTRLAQVVFTATRFPEIDSVLFSIDGEVVEVFSGEGIILDGPQTREDYLGILPNIFLDTPAIGSTVESPVTLGGLANVFEATVSYEIVGSGGVLAQGFTNATCGTGCWGDFSVDVPFSVSEETAGEIVVYEESAQDGSRVNELRYPVTLLPGGTVPVTTTTEAPSSTTSLPGEAFDIGPQAGDIVAVVGVAHDDVLNLRAGPGVGYEPLLGIDPLADDLVATGRHRLLESSIWSEVTVDGVTGWVNSLFVGYLGGVDDLTSWVVSQMGGIPQAETMLDMGTMVAESFDPGEGGFFYEMVVPPTVGDLGEVTFDVVGLLDDAQLGWRLHIFGQPAEGGEGFTLGSVEATALCGRGVTAEGYCV